MLEDLFHNLQRLLTGDAAEYIIAAAAIAVWWVVSTVLRAARRVRGPDSGAPHSSDPARDESRPRRRIPLY